MTLIPVDLKIYLKLILKSITMHPSIIKFAQLDSIRLIDFTSSFLFLIKSSLP